MPDIESDLELTVDSYSDTNTSNYSGEQLSNSREVNFYWECCNADFELVLSSLLIELRAYYLSEGGTSRGFKNEININILRRLIADLHVCYTGDPTRWLAVSFAKPYYSFETRYQMKVGAHGAAVRVRDFLRVAGYAEVVIGFNDSRTGTGRRTRMRATQRLADLFASIVMSDYSITGEAVKLKDENKQLIEYEDDYLTNRIRGDLAIINSLISSHWIDIRISNDAYRQICAERLIELSRNQLVRIFNNNSFEQGGRFFGAWWIEIPRQLRPYIMIDGVETVELDYSSMHLAMLYSAAGLSLPTGDLYELEGYERKIVKMAFTRSVNCNSRAGTINSILNSIQKDIRKANTKIARAGTEQGRNYALEKRQEIIEYTAEQLTEVLQRFEELHVPIRNDLYRESGLQLQCLDSRIANLAMLRLSELNIVALPVHDSFIVKRQHEEQLRAAMISSYNTIVEGTIGVGAAIMSTVESQNDDSVDFSVSMESYSLYYGRQVQHEN
jgi:hypothetical protein